MRQELPFHSSNPARQARLARTRAIATGLLLALLVAACGNDTTDPDASDDADSAAQSASDTGATDPDQPTDEQDASGGATDPEVDDGQDAEQAPQDPVGTISFAGTSYDLVESHWCDTEEALDADEVSVRVFARDADADVTVHAYELTYDDPDRAPIQQISALETVDDAMNIYESGDLSGNSDGYPYLEVDGNQVSIETVLRQGGEQHDVTAEFTIPDEPGMPQYC